MELQARGFAARGCICSIRSWRERQAIDTNTCIGLINPPQQWKQLERCPLALMVDWRPIVPVAAAWKPPPSFDGLLETHGARNGPERHYREWDFWTFKITITCTWQVVSWCFSVFSVRIARHHFPENNKTTHLYFALSCYTLSCPIKENLVTYISFSADRQAGQLAFCWNDFTDNIFIVRRCFGDKLRQLSCGLNTLLRFEPQPDS